MKIMNYLLLLVVSCYLIVFCDCATVAQKRDCCEEYCYNTATSFPQYAHFNTKTAYDAIVDKNSLSNAQNLIASCTPTKVWNIGRHGTRYPSEKSIKRLKELGELRDKIIANYESDSKPTTGALCTEDLTALRNWEWNPEITESEENKLTSQGWSDLEGIAKRFKQYLPSIFNVSYSNDVFTFRSTNSSRTIDSMKAFTKGLFGDDADSITPNVVPEKEDKLLKAYDLCPKWVKQNEEKDNADSEITKFDHSSIYNNVIADVSTKLGFNESLTVREVEDIFDMCRFERAWNLGKSPWCAALTLDQINIIEYGEDLKYYYKSGHGSPINQKVMCHAMHDMMSHINASDGPSVINYFTHSSALQLILVSMGAYNDSIPLKADNYEENRERLWKISDIGPFSVNLAAVKYECLEARSLEPTIKVAFYLNEKLIDWEWCKIGCNWDEVTTRFAEFYNADCDKMLEESCPAGAVGLKLSLFAITICAILAFFY